MKMKQQHLPVGEAPGPFGYDDSPLGGLNKFKNPMESKQISLAGIAKTILKTKQPLPNKRSLMNGIYLY